MSLNQKYTWKDFLKDHPEFKEKKIKRTSAEAEKAFKAAFKAKVKEHLTETEKSLDKAVTKIKSKRKVIEDSVKKFQKSKNWSKAKFFQTRVGKTDAAIANLLKTKENLAQKRKTI